MSNSPTIYEFPSLSRLVERLRDDFKSGDQDFILLYGYNGVGKTQLSMAFKDAGKSKNAGNPDTLYFNAYTEDLFNWDNDLDGDSKRFLKLNVQSRFFSGLRELELDTRIRPHLNRYTNFDFRFDTEVDAQDQLVKAEVHFFRTTDMTTGKEAQPIKISRGEENLFIWCFFLAILELALDESIDTYRWVKHVYIDDPISSLDENNAIAVACDLARLLRLGKDRIKFVISSHHSLFFNVVCNELRKLRHRRYFLRRPDGGEAYTLQGTEATPFFHHVAMLSEVQRASKSGELYTYHFNLLRSVMEKTAAFFGRQDFSTCLAGVMDEALYARALNLLSHGQYSLYEPVDMLDDNKDLFRRILAAFLDKHGFDLPDILEKSREATA